MNFFLFPCLSLLFLLTLMPGASGKEVPLLVAIQAPIIADGHQVGSVKLPPGSVVTFISASPDGVIVSRGDGVPFKIAKEAIAPDALAAALATPTPATTPQPTAAASVQSASIPSGTPPASSGFVSMHPPLKLGWNTVQLESLPKPEIKPTWFDYQFDPTKEKFVVYIPKNYDPKKTYGVLGWTSSGDGLGIPKLFEPLLDEFHLIAINAEHCGNNQLPQRRAGLLVSGILELSKTLPIDKQRLLLSGISGGGRLSALGGFVHPEFFCGSISWCGGNFYKDYPDSQKKNLVTFGITHDHKIPNAVTTQNVSDARSHVHFVLITGEKDFNYSDSYDIEKAMKKEGFQVLLIDEPGLGHAVGSLASMRQALVYVLGEPTKL